MSLKPIKAIVYRDLDLAFTKHPVTNQLVTLKNENSIKRAVKNLVFTNESERFFRPKLYSGVLSSLFENFTPATTIILEDRITNVLENYEPRITVISVRVKPEYDSNRLDVTIVFKILNNREPVEVQFFLENVR